MKWYWKALLFYRFTRPSGGGYATEADGTRGLDDSRGARVARRHTTWSRIGDAECWAWTTKGHTIIAGRDRQTREWRWSVRDRRQHSVIRGTAPTEAQAKLAAMEERRRGEYPSMILRSLIWIGAFLAALFAFGGALLRALR